jgi:uncharacterized protein
MPLKTPALPVHERRVFTMNELRVAPTADGTKTLQGHAAVFNRDSSEMYGFTERVAPGAFTATIAADDIRALFNHDPNYVLGRNTAKTLRLNEDADGLAFAVDLPDTGFARDLATSIERGDITGCSFGFVTRSQQWQEFEDGSMLRTLLDCQLFDVGPVTYPAYPDTDVAVRSLATIADEGKRVLAEARRTTGVPLSVVRLKLDLLERMG